MTYASWKTEGDTVNMISTASVRGVITEEYKQGQTLYPGRTANKIVRVKNTGTADAVPRIKIEKHWVTPPDDVTVRLNGGTEKNDIVSDETLGTDNIIIEYNTADWLQADDGYFYYKKVLSPGDTTEPLMKSFSVDGKKTGGEYKNRQAYITVKMEIVQAAGNGLSYWDKTFDELGITYIRSDEPEIITEVDFADPKKGFEFTVNDGDLFADFKNLVPGESRSQKINISNKWNRKVRN